MIYFIELIGILFQRPMIFGYYNASLGLLLLVFCIFFSILLRKKYDVKFEELKIYIICLVFVFFNCINNLFLGGGDGAIKEFFIGFVVLTSLFFVFLGFKRSHNILFSNFFALIIISTFITVILSGFNVENYKKLEILSFSVKDRSDIDEFFVLIPFSTIPWRMTVGDIILPRATYFSIEPGVGVFIVMLWRYLCRNADGLKSKIFDIIFIIGLFLTASTTMPALIACWFAGRYLFTNKIIYYSSERGFYFDLKKICYITIFIVIAIYLFLYMPYFGYFDKINTHGESFDVRQDLYTSETSIFRYLRILLLLGFYMSIRKYMCKEFPIIYSAMFFVSILNVFAFTPIFFLAVFLSKRNIK